MFLGCDKDARLNPGWRVQDGGNGFDGANGFEVRL